MRASTRAALLVVLSLAAAACGSIHKGPHGSDSNSRAAQISARTELSSRLIHDGRVNCTATASTSVQAGQALGVSFTVQNVSHRVVKLGLAPWNFRVVVRAGDGTKFDTQTLVSPTVPYIAPTELPPGTTKTVPGLGSTVRVRWKGPLRISAMCGRRRLPVLKVGVLAAGPPTDDEKAVADVVAAAGHLFDHCLPQRAGVPVRGQIDAPDGSAPPLDATCSVRIHREGQFWRARALVLSPPGLRYSDVSRPFGRLAVKPGRNAEEIVWEFVVTREGAISVDAAEGDASKSADRMAAFWSWNGSDWVRSGDGRCGGFGNSGGGARGPSLSFVSVCH